MFISFGRKIMSEVRKMLKKVGLCSMVVTATMLLMNYSYSWTVATVTNKSGRNIVFLKTQKVRKTKRVLTEFNILPSSDCWQLSAKYTFQIRREEQSEYRGAEDRPHPL